MKETGSMRALFLAVARAARDRRMACTPGNGKGRLAAMRTGAGCPTEGIRRGGNRGRAADIMLDLRPSCRTKSFDGVIH